MQSVFYFIYFYVKCSNYITSRSYLRLYLNHLTTLSIYTTTQSYVHILNMAFHYLVSTFTYKFYLLPSTPVLSGIVSVLQMMKQAVRKCIIYSSQSMRQNQPLNFNLTTEARLLTIQGKRGCFFFSFSCTKTIKSNFL